MEASENCLDEDKDKDKVCREHSERQAAIDAAITQAYRKYKVGPAIEFQMQNMALAHLRTWVRYVMCVMYGIGMSESD